MCAECCLAPTWPENDGPHLSRPLPSHEVHVLCPLTSLLPQPHPGSRLPYLIGVGYLICLEEVKLKLVSVVYLP